MRIFVRPPLLPLEHTLWRLWRGRARAEARVLATHAGAQLRLFMWWDGIESHDCEPLWAHVYGEHEGGTSSLNKAAELHKAEFLNRGWMLDLVGAAAETEQWMCGRRPS